MTLETPGITSGSAPAMAKVRIWDLPTRLFHWALVALVIAMVWTGSTGKLELHMTLGQAVLTLVLFRLVWGFTGNRYARFSAFVTGPVTCLRYLGSLFSSSGSTHVGHNPAGGYAVLAMLLLLAVQAGSGLFTSDDIFTDGPLFSKVSSETGALLSTVHRRTIWLLLGVIGLHLLANLFYLVVKKNDLISPMVTGRKTAPTVADAGRGGHPLLALVILVVCAAIVFGGIALIK